MSPNTLSLIHAVPALGALLLAVPAGADFIDNLDGTVTDDQTGLMWDKCSWGQTWTGVPPNPNTCSGTATTQNWATALALAVTANNNTHRGYNDWRPPSKKELESLVDITKSTSPIIDTTAFPNTPGGVYWTSTTYAPAPAYAWCVFFYNGGVGAFFKDYDELVRLVRSGQSFNPSDLLGSLITAIASPARGGTVSCAPNPVPSGSSSTCTATPNARYSFANWSGACSGSANPCELENVTEPLGVIGHFFLCGDADGSGAVNIVDALAVARYTAGLPPPPPCNPAAADVNVPANGVNIVDALFIARATAGLATPGSCLPQP